MGEVAINNMLLLLIILFYYIGSVQAITIQLGKGNLIVNQGESYLCNVRLKKKNAYLIPTAINLTTNIANTIPTFGSYFDFFSFLTPTDLACYEQSVNNQSYMFPCPFINNKYAQIRTNALKTSQNTQIFSDISNIVFSYILDNTLFPFPQGAYSYSPININLVTTMSIQVSNIYEEIGIKLIFINTTIFAIFVVIMVIIWCKIKKLQRKMQESKIEQDMLQGKELREQQNNKSEDEIEQLQIEESLQTD